MLTAAVIAAAYLIVAPRSEDLAAHLLRTKLFATEGFGLWNNWWYGGHNVLGYSVLFPPLAALLTPQWVAAISVPVSAALFESLVHRRFGEDAWLGALWFAIGASTNLFTGRLTFALGLAFAVGTALALQRDRPALAAALAALTALASPVDALFAALAGAAQAIWAYLNDRSVRSALPGIGVIVAALVPVLALAIAFPEGGSEPFAFSAMWPIVLISLLAIPAIPPRNVALRAGAALYALGCVAAYVIPTPVGSNATRLGPLIAGPLVALLWWRRRAGALLAVALPLLYLQWQAPVRDIRTADDNREVTFAYFQPMMTYLSRQPGPPFRVEIPFTLFHWEAYEVAPEFPLARGWERQLDRKDNALFYDGKLTPGRYDAWLHRLAVRYVAVPDAQLDYSALQEAALINRGVPFLRLVYHSRHWRVYAVKNSTPIVQGAGSLTALGPNSLAIEAHRPGVALIRVRWSPYWAVTRGSGCVAPAGGFIQLVIRHPGSLRVGMQFSLGRIRATSRRCT
ncbi:MAG TPA: hypothetical protein VLC49_00615 [Solirubrobacteraceae bacterium]|nr:hypothetical protein [Solirubrobacteraceae bacterium]